MDISSLCLLRWAASGKLPRELRDKVHGWIRGHQEMVVGFAFDGKVVGDAVMTGRILVVRGTELEDSSARRRG